MRRFFINLPDENLAYLPEGTDRPPDTLSRDPPAAPTGGRPAAPWGGGPAALVKRREGGNRLPNWPCSAPLCRPITDVTRKG